MSRFIGADRADVLVLAVPVSLFSLGALLFLAGRLDLIGVRTTVQMVMNPSITPDAAEAIIAAELVTYGDRRPARVAPTERS